MKRVLDKLRFVRIFPKPSVFVKIDPEYKWCLNAANNLVKKEVLEPRYGAYYQTSFHKAYDGKSERSAIHFSFGASKTGSYISFECTPYKLTDKEWNGVRVILTKLFGGPEVVADEFLLSEVELAVDIPYPMKDFIFLVPKFRSQNLEFYKRGTLEIGSKKGNRWIRIYNKKLQLQKVKGLVVPDPLTRIEYVRRRLKISLALCLSLPNPFNEIIVVPRNKIGEIQKMNPTDIGLSSFAKEISKGVTGHSAYWHLEDADMRKSIVKLIRPYALNLAGSTVSWNHWIELELNSLRDKFKPNAKKK